MAKTLAEKMFLKPNYSCAILHLPKELATEFQTPIFENEITNIYEFIVAFYTTQKELQNEIKKVKDALKENGLLWIAYPKGKALQTDLNRDILHELMKQKGLDGVSLVSLNDTWSAMRFKKL